MRLVSTVYTALYIKKLFVMPAYHYGVDVTLVSGEGLNTVGTSDVPQLKTF